MKVKLKVFNFSQFLFSRALTSMPPHEIYCIYLYILLHCLPFKLPTL